MSGELPSHANRYQALRRPLTLGERLERLPRATERIAAQVALLRLARDSQEGSVSILDKLDLVVQRRLEHEAHMGARADATLARYAKSGEKVDRAFDKHDSRLDEEDRALDATEAAIDRLSNSVDGGGSGNSSGSERSSGQQQGGGSGA